MADPLFAKKYQPRREYGEKQSWNKKSWPKNVKTLTCPNHQMKKKGHCVHQVSGIDRPRPRTLLEGRFEICAKTPT